MVQVDGDNKGTNFNVEIVEELDKQIVQKLILEALEDHWKENTYSLYYKRHTRVINDLLQDNTYSLYYKHITIANDASSVVSEWRHNLEHHTRVINDLLQREQLWPVL